MLWGWQWRVRKEREREMQLSEERDERDGGYDESAQLKTRMTVA